MVGPLTIYTTSTCTPCVQLKRFLNYKNIPFETLVIDDDEAARKLVVEMTGRCIVPTVQIGNVWISGYKPAEIMEAIAE